MSEQHVWEHVTGSAGIRSIRCERCGWHRFGVTEPPDTRPCPGAQRVNVRLAADFCLQVADIWPDGDWPDDITTEAVAEIMRAHRLDLATEWELAPDYFVAVGTGPEVQV